MHHAQIVEVIEKLIGPLDPVGCSVTDDQRLANLLTLGHVVDDLVIRLEDLTYHARSHEASVKAIGLEAIEICKNLEAIVEGTELPSNSDADTE